MANKIRRASGSNTVVLVGPLVSSSDGVTLRTAGTLPASSVYLWKQGGTSLNVKNEGTAGQLAGSGCYYVTLDSASDCATAGQLYVIVNDPGYLIARHSFEVIQSNPFEALLGTSQKLQVDVTHLDGDQAKGTKLAASVGTMVLGTVFDDAGTHANSTTVVFSDNITEATADHFIGRVIIFRTGNLTNQATVITDYEFVDALYAKFTVTALTEAPADNDTFIIV